MLKLLSCAQGHYWEHSAEEGADESRAFCPVCGQSAEMMPMLDLAPSELASLAEKTTASPPSPLSLLDKDGRPIVAGYEILSELGKSVTGVRLYRARQVLVNRIVTLKVVLAKEDPGQLAWGSLRGEATALGRFTHPNIIAILEAGERERQLFFNAIEHMDGPTLAEYLGGKPLPFRQALALVETLARAVHHAHEKNILHRNLKPASILLQKMEVEKRKDEKTGMPDGPALLLHKESFIPKITDFGLARRPVEGDAGDVELQGEQPCYLAPEQAWGRAKEIGPATDVYALGAILYELISGWPPFHEATVAEMLDAIQTKEPRPLTTFLFVGASRDVEAICRKCLHKQPRRRYASALALAEDLRRCANGYSVQARPVGVAGRLRRLLRRNVRGMALITLGVVLGVMLYVMPSSVKPPPELRSRINEYNYGQQIIRLTTEHREKIFQLETELERVRRNGHYLRYLLLAQRALAAGDKQQALKMLERCSGELDWVWDYLNGQVQGSNRVFEFQANSPILCMAINERYLVAGGGKESADDPRGENGEVSVWDVMTRELLWHWELDAPVRSLCFCNPGLALVSSSRQKGRFGSLQVRNLRTVDPRFSAKLAFPPLRFPDSKPTSVIIGRSLLVVTDNGKVHEVAADNGRKLGTQEVLFRKITPRGLHARLRQVDSDRIALIPPDGKQIVLLPDLHSPEMPIELPGSEGTNFLDLDYDYQNNLLAAAAVDGTIRLWSMQSPDHDPKVFQGHKGRVNSVSFGSHGQRLVSCGQDGKVRIWEVAEGIELLALPGYPSACCVKFQPSPGMMGGLPANPGLLGWQAAGRLAIAHDKKVTVILPPQRKGRLREQ